MVLDALQQLAIRDAGRGEKDVVAANQVVDAEHPVEVGARRLRFLPLFRIARIEFALDLAAKALERGRCQHRLW